MKLPRLFVLVALAAIAASVSILQGFQFWVVSRPGVGQMHSTLVNVVGSESASAVTDRARELSNNEAHLRTWVKVLDSNRIAEQSRVVNTVLKSGDSSALTLLLADLHVGCGELMRHDSGVVVDRKAGTGSDCLILKEMGLIDEPLFRRDRDRLMAELTSQFFDSLGLSDSDEDAIGPRELQRMHDWISGATSPHEIEVALLSLLSTDSGLPIPPFMIGKNGNLLNHGDIEFQARIYDTPFDLLAYRLWCTPLDACGSNSPVVFLTCERLSGGCIGRPDFDGAVRQVASGIGQAQYFHYLPYLLAIRRGDRQPGPVIVLSGPG